MLLSVCSCQTPAERYNPLKACINIQLTNEFSAQYWQNQYSVRTGEQGRVPKYFNKIHFPALKEQFNSSTLSMQKMYLKFIKYIPPPLPSNYFFLQGREGNKHGRRKARHVTYVKSHRKDHTLIRFIKILKLSLELTYRVITAEFERSSNISPNNCTRQKNTAMHQFNKKQYNKSSYNSALTCLFFTFI